MRTMVKSAAMAGVLVASVGTLAARAQTAAGPSPAAAPGLMIMAPATGKDIVMPGYVDPAVKVPFPGGVEATLDITYASVGGTRPLKLNIFRLPDGKTRPAIIFVHGGSYVGGDAWRGNQPVFGPYGNYFSYVASKGYVVVPIEYRLADEGKWPAQLVDTKTAIRFVRAHAADYGIDPKRIAIWGESAGGHIAAMVGSTCGVKEFDGQEVKPFFGTTTSTIQTLYPEQSSCVQAVVAQSPSTDMAKLDAQSESFAKLIHNIPSSSQSRVLGCVLGSTCDAATVQKANAVYYASRGGAKGAAFLLQHGTKDEATPWQQSQLLYDELKKDGIDVELHLLPNVNHYMTHATKDQAKEVLDHFFAFLDRTLKPEPVGKK